MLPVIPPASSALAFWSGQADAAERKQARVTASQQLMEPLSALHDPQSESTLQLEGQTPPDPSGVTDASTGGVAEVTPVVAALEDVEGTELEAAPLDASATLLAAPEARALDGELDALVVGAPESTTEPSGP